MAANESSPHFNIYYPLNKVAECAVNSIMLISLAYCVIQPRVTANQVVVFAAVYCYISLIAYSEITAPCSLHPSVTANKFGLRFIIC